MTLFRICTENKNKSDVLKLVNVAFESYSVWEGVGYWKGKAEPSLVIEIWTADRDRELVCSTADAIKHLNAKEAVLVQEIECRGELV